MTHHIVRIIWGSQGLVSGIQRGKMLSNYAVATRLKEDVMYIVLKKE
jgi:hypothetical protein